MLVLHYDPLSEFSISDGCIQEYVRNIYDFYNPILRDKPEYIIDKVVGQEVIIWQFRLAVKEGKIDPAHIQIKYKDEIIRFDKDGRLSHYPEGFCCIIDDVLGKLL